MEDKRINNVSNPYPMLSASGLDVLRTKAKAMSEKSDVAFFDEDKSFDGLANRRINPLLSVSITRMIGVPHLNELFDEMASQLVHEGRNHLSALGVETYVDSDNRPAASPRIK